MNKTIEKTAKIDPVTKGNSVHTSLLKYLYAILLKSKKNHHLLSTEWADYVEEPMKYQALRTHFFSMLGGWRVFGVGWLWVVVGWVMGWVGVFFGIGGVAHGVSGGWWWG